jgi:hypothetical protein
MMPQVTLRHWTGRFVSIAVTFLASLAWTQTTGPYSITGTVINSMTGSPLPHSSVSLVLSKDRSQMASVVSDEDGTFQFLHLPAGRYILGASHRGYMAANYDSHDGFTTALVTGEGLDCCANLLMKLVPGGVISGVVTEDSGDPVSEGQIVLYRESNNSGTERMQRVRVSSIDETGAYEFSGLWPGDYFLAVHAHPWYAQQVRAMQIFSARNANRNEDTNNEQHSPMDLVYAITFYPDTTDESAATPIPIKGGEHLQINFSMHPVPAVHIKLPVPAPGTQGGPFFMSQVQQQVFGSPEPEFAPGFMHNDGQSWVMEMSIPPGQYQVKLLGSNNAPGREITPGCCE